MKEFEKITERMLYEQEEDVDKYLCDRVITFLKGINVDNICQLYDSLIDCESPIEQLLSIHLENINLLSIHSYNPFIDVIAIEKQQEIKISEKVSYRVDFLITVNYKNQGFKAFVIECDGHEFHQKTKEQVEKDNQKTRNLQLKDFEVIRFSGTEIWNRGYKCACEVRNIILSKCKYIKDNEV